MEAYLAAAVRDSLALGLHDNARFLCERLVAERSSEVRMDMVFKRGRPTALRS